MKGKLLVFITVGLALVFVSPPLVQQDRNQNLWRSLGNMIQSAAPAAAADVNLALGKPVQQSSTDWGGEVRRAVDGNTDGNWGGNSVSHTANQAMPWWQVDLGAAQGIRNIRIWNRTDCCGERLAKFHVLVSDYPFASGDLNVARQQPGVWDYYHDAVAGRTTDISVNRNGRYVRVQLSGTNFLQLAEVEVFGEAGYASSPSVSPVPSQQTGRDYTSAIPRTPSASFNPAGQGFASSPYVLPPPSQQTGRDYTGAIPRTLSASFNLTGRWRSNDGGAYFLRQVGTQLWWYGQSGDNGRTWTNVFQGRIEGSQVIGSWADVPHGQIMHNGEMSLQIVAPNFLRAVNRTGGFGGSEWSR